jgi:short-subunit dehydrogenase
MTDNALLEEFNINVVSVHRMTSALMPLLQKGNRKTIINMYGKIDSYYRFPEPTRPAFKDL